MVGPSFLSAHVPVCHVHPCPLLLRDSRFLTADRHPTWLVKYSAPIEDSLRSALQELLLTTMVTILRVYRSAASRIHDGIWPKSPSELFRSD